MSFDEFGQAAPYNPTREVSQVGDRTPGLDWEISEEILLEIERLERSGLAIEPRSGIFLVD